MSTPKLPDLSKLPPGWCLTMRGGGEHGARLDHPTHGVIELGGGPTLVERLAQALEGLPKAPPENVLREPEA